MESKRAFGEYIREKRKGLGLSQRDLAGKLFISESAVSKWERGYLKVKDTTPIPR